MWVNEYVRIPFLDNGRTKEGVDCWGLVRLIYQERLGIELPVLNLYDNTRDKEKISHLIEEKSKEWIPVEKGDEKPYDVLVFKLAGQPMHVGLVVKKGLMLHCERGSGTVPVFYNEEHQWFRRLVGIYRNAQCSNVPTSV